jgi:hypothetical protein
MSIIKINQEKLQKIKNKERIAELKELLAKSDYKVSPDYDKDNSNVKSQRQKWRSEIRILESQLPGDVKE